MLWYYDAIIDWMIANPGHPLSECAAHVGKTPNTISIIINSDMFKAALAARKASFQMQHDFGIIERTTRVATAGLDALLEVLDKKRDKIPIGDLNTVTEGALKRLGYGVDPKPQMGVQVNVNGQATIVAPVSPQDLAEARMALRQVQMNNSQRPSLALADPIDKLLDLTPVKEAEPVDVVEEGREDAPAPIST